MYGLTEAFRSTYLPPAEVDRRPDSIGKAIPNAEILVLREDGTPVRAGRAGRARAPRRAGRHGLLERPGEDRRALPAAAAAREAGLVLPEIAVFSGDTVRTDEEGFLYFIGRRDEMIKTSGYRVSPTEVEEVLYGTQLVGEVRRLRRRRTRRSARRSWSSPRRATGADARRAARCWPRAASACRPTWCRRRIDVRAGPLPRNPNGKIDRKALATRVRSDAVQASAT